MDEELKASLRRTYDMKAGERDNLTISDLRLGPRNDFAALLKREGKKTLLELGSGPGKDGRYFKDQGFDVLCTDLSPEMVRLCREKGLEARVMDNTNLELPPASFDAVYSMNSLLHLPKKDLPAVLGQIRTVLKTDGLCFIGVYGGIDFEGIWEEDHYDPKRFYSFFTDDKLKPVLEAAFEIISFRSIATGNNNDDLDFQAALMGQRPATD
jgi:SAM-dependent methyltransferase